MQRSTLARAAFSAVAAAGIVVAAACSSDSGNSVSEATDSAASAASEAADAAGSAASEASEAAGSAASDASEAGGSMASEASESAGSMASEASEAAGSAASDASEAASDAAGSAAEIGDTTEVNLPDGSTAAISTKASEMYEAAGGATGSLGTPEGATEAVGDGTVTPFQNGSVYTSEAGDYIVQGEIARVYEENGGPEGDLGFPTADETTIADGFESTFQNGTITWTGTAPENFTENVTIN